jgi:hypothetical protein
MPAGPFPLKRILLNKVPEITRPSWLRESTSMCAQGDPCVAYYGFRANAIGAF